MCTNSALALLQKAIINSSIYEKKDGVYIADVNNSNLPFYISKFNDLKGHFRVFIDCNQYEITVKVVPDKNLYKNNEAVTVKMRKTEAVNDYIVEHLHKQSVLNKYYSK